MTDRRSRENARSIQNVYVDGNAARRLQEIPDRRYSSGRPVQNKKEKVLGVQLLQKRQVVQERSAEQRRETAERQ